MTDAEESSTMATLAARGWPHLVGVDISATEVRSGLSGAPLWKIACAGGSFALRGWRSDQHLQATLTHRLLAHLQQQRTGWTPGPFPVAENQGTLFVLPSGDRWELAPWLPGETNFDSQPSFDKLESACRALAEFHLVAAELPTDRAVHQSSVGRHSSRLGQLERELSTGSYANVEASRKPLVDAMRAGTPIAKELLAPLEGRALVTQLCWGDAWHNNFLFQGDQVSGLIDFATVRLDTPAADLARLLGSATSENGAWWQAGLEAYSTVCPLSRAERQATKALDASGVLLSLANWVGWLVIERREFRDPAKALRRLEHFAGRLDQLLGRSVGPSST